MTRFVAPSGGVVEATGEQAKRLLAAGFVEADKPKPKKKPKKKDTKEQ